jgi:transposase InsO family protein
MILALLDETIAAGARIEKASGLLGLTPRTVTRWRAAGGGDDARGAAVTSPAHKLSDAERQAVLDAAHRPEFRDLSPRQIVPLLADRGEYIASESTFYRVLREAGELAHRGHARPRKCRKPDEHVAATPNQVWSWDITYLRSPTRGVFFYLYLIVDIYSRKLVGWRVEAEESGDLASELVTRAVAAEDVDRDELVLHADNGGPMKASTMLATLQRLGVVPSFSRPSVSDDNPFAEALFRTLKYRPGYPRKPFDDIEAARAWVAGFVGWYNDEHLHSAIRYVTPADRHAGRDKAILAKRRAVYRAARKRTPRRWTGETRNWAPVGAVYLNPVKHEVHIAPIATPIS